MRNLLLTLSLAALVGLAPGARAASPLDGTAWVQQGVPSPPTLRFEGGMISGSDGCNRFRGTYTADTATFTLPAGMATTRRTCPADMAARARAFIDALSRTRSWRTTEDGMLVLRDEAGTALVTLAAQEAALPGTAWRVTGINNGKGGVASTIKGTRVTMEFNADGHVAGTTGCNRYSARYLAEGTSLRFTEAVSTRMACISGALIRQEQEFFAALPGVATMDPEADRLTLRRTDGATALTLTRDRGP